MAENSKASIGIKGMTCSAIMRIQKAVSKMPGVDEANLNFATEKLNITYNLANFSWNIVKG